MKQARRSNTKAGDRVLYLGESLHEFYPVTVCDIPKTGGARWTVKNPHDDKPEQLLSCTLYRCSDAEMEECLALYGSFRAVLKKSSDSRRRHANARLTDLFEDAKRKAQEALQLAEYTIQRGLDDDENAAFIAQFREATAAFNSVCDNARAHSHAHADAQKAVEDKAVYDYEAFAERMFAQTKRTLFSPY